MAQAQGDESIGAGAGRGAPLLNEAAMDRVTLQTRKGRWEISLLTDLLSWVGVTSYFCCVNFKIALASFVKIVFTNQLRLIYATQKYAKSAQISLNLPRTI